MKVSYLIGLLFLLGCDKDSHDPSQSFLHMGSDVHAMPLKGPALNILGMGQSNMANIPQPLAVNALQQTFLQPIHFVNCAVGGTYIRDWAVGGALYNACMAAMPKPDFILFYQGEADSQVDGDYATWAQKFTAIVQTLNPPFLVFAQLGADPDAQGPVPIVNADELRWLHWEDVKCQQSQVYLPNIKMIKTDDLATEYDHVHLTAASQFILMQRFANAYKGSQ